MWPYDINEEDGMAQARFEAKLLTPDDENESDYNKSKVA
jgi:hypothetical protein